MFVLLSLRRVNEEQHTLEETLWQSVEDAISYAEIKTDSAFFEWDRMGDHSYVINEFFIAFSRVEGSPVE